MRLDIVLWPCNTSCVIIDLTAKQGKEWEWKGFAQRGVGVDRTQHVCGIYIFTGVHIHVYMQVCPCVCVTGLVSYQRNGCVGPIRESPAGGDALEMAPWQPPGQGGVCICAALALDCSCGGWR